MNYTEEQVQAMLDGVFQEEDRRRAEEIENLHQRIRDLEKDRDFWKESAKFSGKLADTNWDLYRTASRRADTNFNLWAEVNKHLINHERTNTGTDSERPKGEEA